MIGILAGMGPKSTGPFIDIVVDQCQKIYGAKDDIDFPPMMIYSCPTPFYLDKPLEHEQMKESIIRGAQRLEDTGITFMAMPCNTAHLYYEEIQNSLTVPLLNMVDETIKAIPEKTSRVTILATPATVQSGIYQEALLTAGINVFQKDSWQDSVNGIITNIKDGNLGEAAQVWKQLSEEVSNIVDTVIIACTDLHVVSDKHPCNLNIVDSSTSLAKAVVHTYLLEI